MVRSVSGLETSELHHCSFQMMCFCSFFSVCDLQQALGRFAVKCELVRMRVSISKSKAMVFCQKTVDCPLTLGDELLPQAREFKYHEWQEAGVGDGQMAWCSVSGNTGIVPYCRGEEGAELEGKA